MALYNSPCLDCRDRVVYSKPDGGVYNCHTYCSKYIAFQEHNDSLREGMTYKIDIGQYSYSRCTNQMRSKLMGQFGKPKYR